LEGGRIGASASLWVDSKVIAMARALLDGDASMQHLIGSYDCFGANICFKVLQSSAPLPSDGPVQLTIHLNTAQHTSALGGIKASEALEWHGSLEAEDADDSDAVVEEIVVDDDDDIDDEEEEEEPRKQQHADPKRKYWQQQAPSSWGIGRNVANNGPNANAHVASTPSASFQPPAVCKRSNREMTDPMLTDDLEKRTKLLSGTALKSPSSRAHQTQLHAPSPPSALSAGGWQSPQQVQPQPQPQIADPRRSVLEQFVSATGLKHAVAQQCLSSNDNNLQKAFHDFQTLKVNGKLLPSYFLH